MQYTVLVLLFGVASFRNVHIPFLTVTLLSEVSGVFYALAKIQEMAGTPHSALSRRVVRGLERATLLLCRCVPHALIGYKVAGSRDAFSSPLLWGLATFGMAMSNWVSLRRLLALGAAPTRSAMAAAKVHAS